MLFKCYLFKKIQWGTEIRITMSEKAGTTQEFLNGVSAYLLPAGIEKARITIFKTQLKKFGGRIHETLQEETTHIIVDDKMEAERMCRLLKRDSPPTNVCVVKTAWLSTSIKEKMKASTADYSIDLSLYQKRKRTESDSEDDELGKQDEVNICDAKPVKMWHSYKKSRPLASSDALQKVVVNSDSDYEASDEEKSDDLEFRPIPGTSDSSANSTPNTSPSKALLSKGNWVCTQSSKNPLPNLNQMITEKLEEMVQKYKSTSDKWRAFGYQKAIQVLKKHPKPITSWEEARALPGIGTRLADKIWEIAESGELRKLNEFKSDKDIKVLELFTNVWGAGAHTARNWIQQGFSTLEDLETKAKLTHQQKVGLKHYDDFLDRMPREEAAEIEKTVRSAAESLQDGVIAHACGSYRRGKLTCGDVDILVTHPDGKSHRGLFGKLTHLLKQQGFLTDDLVSAEDNGSQKKYLGVCKLPGEKRKYRRIDIIVVPYDEYACALVYFTGSAHLNRSLRLLAKKMGMSLSEHSLNKGVIRKGTEKIYEGTPVPTPTEESVFLQLGVPYRPPEERDH